MKNYSKISFALLLGFFVFFTGSKVYAQVLSEIRLNSETVEVNPGPLPEYVVTTTTDHASIEPYGSNTVWLHWPDGYATWHGFGADTPMADLNPTTHYAMRICVNLQDEYEFDENTRIIFNGVDITDLTNTRLDVYEWGGYVYIDLGTVNVGEPIYTVVYDYNGGTMNGENTHTYYWVSFAMDGTADYFMKDVTAPTGKVLDYVLINGERKIFPFQFEINNNYTVKYMWKDNTIITRVKRTIKFNANGGSVKPTSKIVYTNSTYGVLPTPSRKGYSFLGWYTAKSGGVKVLASTNTGSTGNRTLYARWALTKYKINYNLNGGTNNKKNPATYTMNNKVSFKNPSKKGYIFKGWYKDKKFKSKFTTIKKGTTGNKTVYAKWTPIKYKISYNKNGGTGSMSASTRLKYDKKYTLKTNKFKKKGYSFAGWNTKKNGKGKAFGNKAKVKNLTAKNGANVTLYAQWKKINYKITYKLNGGTNNKNNPATYTVTSTVTLKKPSRKLYTFVGWYSDSKYKKKITKITKGSVGNKTLYAKWKKNHYDCQGSFVKNVPRKNVTLGYNDHVNWTWSTGGEYNDKCKQTYHSSNTNVAVVSSGGYIETKSKGNAYITNCLVDKKTNTEIACFKGLLSVIEEDDNTTVQNDIDKIVNKYVGTWYLEGYADIGIVVRKTKYYDETMAFYPKNVDPSNGNIYDEIVGGYSGISINYKNWSNDLKNNAVSLNEDSITINTNKRFLKFVKEPGSSSKLGNSKIASALGQWYLFNRPDVTLDISIDGKYSIDEFDLFNDTPYGFKVYSPKFIFNLMRVVKSNEGYSGTYTGSLYSDEILNDHVTIDNDVLTITNGDDVFVFYREPTVIEVEELSLNTNNLTLDLNEKYTFTLSILPDEAYNKELVWESDNTDVATVSSTGEVRAVGPGTTTITVSLKNGQLSDSCIVTVIKHDVEQIELNKSTIDLYIGDSEVLQETIYPNNASYKDVTWSSSNSDVATVSDSGEIIALAKGTTVITVTTVDGNKTAECIVNVNYRPITASVNMGITYTSSSSGTVRGLSIKFTPTGGNGVFSTYKFKLYNSSDTLLYESEEMTSNETILTGVGNGSYYVEYEITDSVGNVGTGRSSAYTISI